MVDEAHNLMLINKLKKENVFIYVYLKRLFKMYGMKCQIVLIVS